MFFFLSFCNTFLVFVIFWLYFTHFVILWQYFVGFCYLSTIFQWFLSYFGKLSNPQKILTWSAPPPPWLIPVFSLRNSQQQTFTFKSLTLNMINLSILLLNKALCQGQKINYERQRWKINDPTSPDYLLGPLYPKTHTPQEGFIFGKAAFWNKSFPEVLFHRHLNKN